MRVVFFLSLACSFATPLFAQENNDSTQTSYLNEITISANRWEQNMRDVSNRVTKVGQPIITHQNPQTSADLLGLSNQVFIQKSQLGGGSPMIRGFATNRVLLVVDGVRMNNAIFRSGNLQNVISLDPNAVLDTEVIFGPGSVMYGSDAIGGVMDFHTLRPEFSTHNETLVTGNALARYSSANAERTGHVDVNIALNKWAFTTSVTKSLYNDLTMGSNGPVDYTRPDYQVRDASGNDISVPNSDPDKQRYTGYDQLNVMQKIRFSPGREWDISYGFHFSKTSDVPRYDRLLLKSEGVFTSAEWYYGPQRWMMHMLQATYLKKSLVSDRVKLTAAWQDYEESRHNRNFTGGNRNRRTDRFEEVRAFSVNMDVDKQINGRTDLFYGVEYVTNTVGSTAERVDIVNGTVSGVSTRYPDGSVWRSGAAYATLRYRFNSNWLVNAGTRYSHVYTYAPYDRTYFDFPFTEATLRNGAVNGSIGVVFSPDEDWKIYSNVSTGFRAPNVDDIGKVFDSQPGTVVVPNPDLKPETAYNAELGFTGRIFNSLSFDISAFYTWLDNAIIRGAYTFNGQSRIDYDGTMSGVLALQNSSKLSVRGIQVGVFYEINRYLRFTTNLNVQDGVEKDVLTGSEFSPAHVAPAFGSTQLSFKNTRVQITLYATYQGEISYPDLALSERADAHLYTRDKDGNPYAPRWATLNMKATYSFSKFLHVSAGLENIFDERYRPYSSGITAPGRNAILAVRVKV